MRITVRPQSRVDRDPQTDAIRSWFDKTVEPTDKAGRSDEQIAAETLRESADLFGWSPELSDLRAMPSVQAQHATSARFIQEFHGVPVDDSEIVVDIDRAGRVYSIYNHYHYRIPEDLDTKPSFTARRATTLVDRLLEGYDREVSRPELIVYRFRRGENQPPKPAPDLDQLRARLLGAAPQTEIEYGAEILVTRLDKDDVGRDEGPYFLAWDVRVTTSNPAGYWRILIDAKSGRVVNVVDLAQYATAPSSVFDPNPTVTTGDLTLSGSSALATLNGQRGPVTLQRLNAAVGGQLRLDGSHVNMEDFESPTYAEPTQPAATADFATTNWTDRHFLASMCYFHIDRFQDYIQTVLGMTNAGNFSIPVDPQGLNGADNSHYIPATKKIAFGEGGVPDDADAFVILHEYGHALQDNQNPGFSAYSAGVSEGFGDFLAAVYYDDKHVNPATTRGLMMAWDASPWGSAGASWAGRRYDVAWLFDGSEWAGANGHIRGQLWAATTFEIFRKLGGDSQWYPAVRSAARDLMIRLHLMANAAVPASPTTTQMAQQIEAADDNLGGWRYADGLHGKVIYDTFRRRHLTGYPDLAVDVYVDDGRAGGYGSPSGSDLFSENLWDDNYWDTQDIWVRTSPYASPAAQAAGGPADHVEPPTGSPAYLYVRVRNRGTGAAGSGPVTVKAFHCEPGLGLVWPDAWSPMDTPSLAVANILPGPANGVVVGPFDWTPTEVGHECVLVIVESANDPAVTQNLAASAHVNHSDLVPFDNNIAQRNLVPTAPKGTTKRGFWITNPELEPRTVELRVEDNLPDGWRWRLNLADPAAVRLGGLERRWVELTIDQAEGAAVTDFRVPARVTLAGSIEGRGIGGMTFYVAPPEATRPSRPGRAGEVELTNPLLCLNLPWEDLEVEGELELRMRFRSRP